MSELNVARLSKSMGEGMVEIADSWLDKISPLVKGDHRVIRLNLIAYCTFSLVWSIDKKLNAEQLHTFTTDVIQSAAERAAVPPLSKLIEMFRSRHEGFLLCVLNLPHDQRAFDKYFSACCSVNSVKIGFLDILPDPDALEQMGKATGGLSDEGRMMVSKVRATKSPAIYSMDPFQSVKLFGTLMNLLEQIKHIVERL